MNSEIPVMVSVDNEAGNGELTITTSKGDGEGEGSIILLSLLAQI